MLLTHPLGLGDLRHVFLARLSTVAFHMRRQNLDTSEGMYERMVRFPTFRCDLNPSPADVARHEGAALIALVVRFEAFATGLGLG